MACALTQGRAIDCRNNAGGIQEVLIANFGNITIDTVASGVITAMTQAAATSFFKYNLEKENGSLVETQTGSLENGTNFWTQTLAMIFHKMDADKRNNILLLAGADLHVIVETQNGVYWWVGLKNGANLTASTAGAGKAYGDLNGYNITITGSEPLLANELSSTAFGTLTIAA